MAANALPFIDREHRLERRPRLEVSDATSGMPSGLARASWHKIVPVKPWRIDFTASQVALVTFFRESNNTQLLQRQRLIQRGL